MADLFDRRRMFLHRADPLHRRLAGQRARRTPRPTLIVSRGAQGAGAALLTPAAMSIVMTDLRRQAARHRTRRVGHRRQHGHRRRRALRRHSSPAPSTGARSSSSTSRSASPSWSAPCTSSPRHAVHGRASAASTSPARSPWSAGCSPWSYAVETHHQPRLDRDHDPRQLRRRQRSCWPRSRSSSAGSPRRWSRRGSGGSDRWSRPRPSWPASPVPSSAHLPQLAVPAAGPRLLRDRRRPGVPAAGRGHHAERRGRLQAAAATPGPAP